MYTPRRSARVRRQTMSSVSTRNSSMSIANLLNPKQEHNTTPTTNTSPSAPTIPRAVPSIPLGSSKKEKDMPTYRRQRPTLDVVYPPFASDESSEAFRIQLAHSMFPLSDIDEHAAHIPYSSSKTQFREKTGRTAVEVFMYEFRMPSDASKGKKRYVVYWDYNYGLVRMTNIYKACGLAKIIPRKALQANPGLLDISHSLTGGNLEAQGYWVPFEAAKALAAKFAYSIRYLLTPIFGPGFPATCVPPDHPEYRNYKIDPAIVEQCKEDTKRWTRQTPATATKATDESDYASSSAGSPNGSAYSETLPSSPRGTIASTTRPLIRRVAKRARLAVSDSSASPPNDSSVSPVLPGSGVSSATSVMPFAGPLMSSPNISPRTVPRGLLLNSQHSSSQNWTSSTDEAFDIQDSSRSSFWSGPPPVLHVPQWNTPASRTAPVSVVERDNFTRDEHQAAEALMTLLRFPVHGIVDGAVRSSAASPETRRRDAVTADTEECDVLMVAAVLVSLKHGASESRPAKRARLEY